MKKRIIYLDNAATTKIDNIVFAEMLPYLRENRYGNPSSLYSFGRESKEAINNARKQVANAINAEPSQIFFTSGATESNNWVLSNFDRVLCSRIEHSSIIKHPNCTTMDYNPLDYQIYSSLPNLVTHMMVNNETGNIYDIKSMVEIAHEKRIPFHTDATQAFGHIPIDVKELNVDSLSMSGHKIHTPKGIGVLYLKDPSKYKPLLYGGNQENGLRAGTENIASIIGIGKTCELHNYNVDKELEMKQLKQHLQKFIEENIPDIIINSGENSASNILNVSFKDVEGESLMLMLDREGICVSSGSACNSGSLEPSYVLKDLRVPDDYIYGTIRFSFSKFNSLEEIIETEVKLKTIIEKLRCM